MLIFNQALFSPALLAEPKNASDDHTTSILALIELCTTSPRSLFKILLKEVKCLSFENDGELMLMVVQAHSEQQQQCFRLILLDEHVNELLYPIRIQIAKFASQIDSQIEGISFLSNFP